MSNDIALTAPRPTLLCGMNGALLQAPAPSLSATMTWPGDSQLVTSALIAPAPELTAVSYVGNVLTAVLTAPLPSLGAVNNPGVIITVALRAPVPFLSAVVATGNIATAALTAPVATLAAAAFSENTIVAVLRAPAPRLLAALGFVIPSTYRTWVINTRKMALTEYGPEFAFNSYATLNGQVLACGSSGIVSLGAQDQDDTTAITARVRTGQDAFASSLHKRVPRLYTSGSFAGAMIFRTITEGGTRSYGLPFNDITRLQQRRIPVGKGPRSRFWQFEVENVAGADFSLHDILVYPVGLRRRVQ